MIDSTGIRLDHRIPSSPARRGVIF